MNCGMARLSCAVDRTWQDECWTKGKDEGTEEDGDGKGSSVHAQAQHAQTRPAEAAATRSESESRVLTLAWTIRYLSTFLSLKMPRVRAYILCKLGFESSTSRSVSGYNVRYCYFSEVSERPGLAHFSTQSASSRIARLCIAPAYFKICASIFTHTF